MYNRIMSTLWLIQTNMGSSSDIQKWTDALDYNKIDWFGFKSIPFDHTLPDIDTSRPIVCYGSTGFVTLCRNSNKFNPGVWHDDINFTWSAWAKNLGNLLFNSPADCIETTIGNFSSSNYQSIEDDGNIFARPDKDIKEFNGAIWQTSEFLAWCNTIGQGGFEPLTKDTPIVIGKPFGISREWRCFMVDGNVIASTLYKQNGKLNAQIGCPDTVKNFAHQVAKRWTPAPIFTLDICESNDNLYVMEAQGFNSAGSYAADLNILVKEVSEFAKNQYDIT